MNNTFIQSSKYSEKKWYLVTVEKKPLGRMASEIAYRLMGKHKIDYHPSVDIGDYVIVINSEKVLVTGLKEKSKIYFSHSGRPGGKKIETLQALRNRLSERILEKAVKGMLPKNRLGRELFNNLFVYAGPTHPHAAQQPKALEI